MSDAKAGSRRTITGSMAGAPAFWAAAGLLLIAACTATAPAPTAPPATPTPMPTAAAAAPVPPSFVRVTGSRVNVREAPRGSARALAKLARGTRVEKRGEDGDWVQVVLSNGTTGWVNAGYVAPEAPCPPDSVEPEVASAPPVGFASDGGHGRVVLEATVSRAGEVAGVNVKDNGTGSAELAKRAGEELRQMRFKPYIRGCKAVPFIYVFTRNY